MNAGDNLVINRAHCKIKTDIKTIKNLFDNLHILEYGKVTNKY